jgi:hypothetical protein
MPQSKQEPRANVYQGQWTLHAASGFLLALISEHPELDSKAWKK